MSRVNITLMDDVRDPHKWRAFILKMQRRAAEISALQRRALFLKLDLNVDEGALHALFVLHAAVYRLTRVARAESSDLNRKEIVNLFNAIIHGPNELRGIAFKIINKLEP